MVIEYILSDLYRYYGKTDLFTLIIGFFENNTFRYQVWLRMCHSSNFLIKFLGKFFRKFSFNKNLIIPSGVKIGYGLYIGHNGPLVINDTVEIGNNCNLSQFTTIGSNKGKAAKIGDNVYIGPNVCIVENVRIGNNCTIGAGSVVTKDIPDGATAVGNYAKVINYNNSGKYIHNEWDMQSCKKKRIN